MKFKILEPTCERRLVTLPEAAAYLGTTVWAIRCLIWDGRLARIRLGRRYLIDVDDLDGLVEALKRRETA
ncbi:MAG: excisionase family DNA-binding protein [Acidobacteria bacterium]|nr:excisionase family DNA-binding protein [Acidobacteriota bacterium]